MALLGLAVLAGALWCAAPAPVRAQEEEDIAGSIEKYRALVALATQKLEDLDLPEALARFTEVIDGYKSGRLPAGTALTRQIVGQAYEGRARTYANLGRAAEAEADFEALIRFDITWPIDRTRTSPKIVALFDKVRKRIVGTLTVSSEPPGAVVSLNGEAIGRTPLFDRELTAGPYELKLEAEGFNPVKESIAIAGGARLERSARLTANARDLLVATTPAGARVSLDGKERGVTFGTAGPEYADLAARMEVALTDISSPLQLEHVAPGDHLLKIEKECFEPQTLSIKVGLDPNDSSALRYEPIRLTPSQGAITLDSTPPGAEAFLDGQSVGRAPARLDGICSGRHEVALRVSGVGQWVGTVDVVKGQRAAVNERVRMTLAYVGMTVPGPAGQPPAGEQALAEALARLKNVNVIAPGSGLPDALVARKRAGAGEDTGADLPAAWLASVAAATGADLILAARPGEGGFERRVEITLVAAGAAMQAPPGALQDRLQLSLDDKARMKDLMDQIDAPAALTAPWIGLETIELHRAGGPVVLRVQPDSPASKAGVRPGEILTALGGKPIATPRDLRTILSGLREGAQASLTLHPPGAEARQVNMVIGSTPVMLRPGPPGPPAARLAAELAFRARLEAALGRPDSAERTAALTGLAALLMSRGMHEAALKEALDRLSLPEGGGISAGTIEYLKGLCLLRLGRQAEARQQLAAAAGQPDATLWSHAGPPVAERARRLLQTP